MLSVVKENMTFKLGNWDEIGNTIYFIQRDRFKDIEMILKAFNVATEHINNSGLDANYKEAFTEISTRINNLTEIKFDGALVDSNTVKDYCNKLNNFQSKYSGFENIGTLIVESLVIDVASIRYIGTDGLDIVDKDYTGTRYATFELSDEILEKYKGYMCMTTFTGEDIEVEFLKAYTEILRMLSGYKSDYTEDDYIFKFTVCGLHFDTISAFNRLLDVYVYLINCSSFETGTLAWYDKDHLEVPLQWFDATQERLPVYLKALADRYAE